MPEARGVDGSGEEIEERKGEEGIMIFLLFSV